MNIYGVDYNREILSVFNNADEVARRHPLIKAPVLRLPNGELIYDS